MNSNKKSWFEVHIAVFLFGVTGLFGKLIELSPFIIVFGRVFVAALFMLVWLLLSKEPIKLNKRSDYKNLVMMGILLAVHWTTFFASIQLSNVAIGVLTFSTFPVFVSLFRPLIYHDKIAKKEVIFGLITIVGILFIVPFKDLFTDTMAGSIIGLISGALYAVFTIFNEKLVKTYSGKKVAFYEQAVATVFLLPSIFIIKPVVTTQDIALLILLGTLFTGVAHTMFINGLKHVSAYMASIITMMEPLYAIILAYLLLGEALTVNTAVGGIIILSTVVFISLDNLNQR
jgi:drug/metabolite transporter (DMT)-like permease